MPNVQAVVNLQGHSIINGESKSGTGAAFYGVDAATGERLEPVYHCASIEDLKQAAELADEAFMAYRKLSGAERGRFLRMIADGIEAIVPEIVERANRETALPEARLKGEAARTINQLRLFAQVVEEGSWANARIDPAQPDRKPLPRSDIRSMMRPLGPVAVFGASNFPLAFSVAGGDTAAAFAGGNPVIVKAHHAHPGTSELVGQVIARCVKECGLPAGLFALHLRTWIGDWDGACGASQGKSRRIHRFALGGQGADGSRGGAAGADSVLHGDEQREPGVCAA